MSSRGHSQPIIHVNKNGESVIVIDEKTHALKTIGYEHHEIHDGNHYLFQEGFVLNAATKTYLLTVPNSTKWPHVTFTVMGSQDTSATLIEGTTLSSTNAASIINRDRNTGTPVQAGMIISKNPSGVPVPVNDASIMFSTRFGIAANAGGRGGAGVDFSLRNELILRQNTKYLFHVTAASANENNITVSFDWYEHTNT